MANRGQARPATSPSAQKIRAAAAAQADQGDNFFLAQGTPGAGVTQGELVRRSNFFRDNYNPLRGLTIARLMALFEQAERGAFPEVQLTLRKAMKRYPILRGFAERLTGAIEELDWDVKIKEPLPVGATPAMSEAQRKYLRERYDLVENLTEAIGRLALAEICGYMVLQKHRHLEGPNEGAVKSLYWLEPWVWSRDGYYGDFYYNENSLLGIGLGSVRTVLGENNRIGGDALPREDFVIQTIESPIYEIALIAFVNWLMGRKDWAAYVEIFGLPNAIVILPPNIPQDKVTEFESSAEKVADGISGALPPGSDVKFPASANRAEPPMEKFCEVNDKDVVFAGTGGQLTMLANDKGGLGEGPSKEHADAWESIAKAKARKINEVLQRDFDAVELGLEFPGQPVCAYFELYVRDDEDVSDFMDTVIKGDALGLEANPAEISERSGIQFKPKSAPAPGAAPAGQPPDLAALPQKAAFRVDDRAISGAVRNRIAADVKADPNLLRQFAGAVRADLRPFAARLQRILQISDPALFAEKIKALTDEIGALSRDINADPAAAHTLEKINLAAAAGVVSGSQDGKKHD